MTPNNLQVEVIQNSEREENLLLLEFIFHLTHFTVIHIKRLQGVVLKFPFTVVNRGSRVFFMAYFNFLTIIFV